MRLPDGYTVEVELLSPEFYSKYHVTLYKRGHKVGGRMVHTRWGARKEVRRMIRRDRWVTRINAKGAWL